MPVPDLAAAVPARRLELQRVLLESCEGTGTRFAVLDALPGADAADAIAQRNGLSEPVRRAVLPVGAAGRRARRPTERARRRGVCASDAARGVGAAPANLELPGVLDLVPAPTPAELAALGAAGVDPLRSLPGRGIRVWGARTLAGSDDQEWTAIGVSRLFVDLARWLAANAPAFAFEPDDLSLWIRIRRQLTERLRQLWRDGALAGISPEEAFYVQVRRRDQPARGAGRGARRHRGGAGAQRPAEFVVVRLVQQDGRTTVV